MKTLFLLRHGDAVSSPHLHDVDRPLSDKGQATVETAGWFLKQLRAPIRLTLSSPLLRAVQTARIIGAALGIEKTRQSEYLVPGSRLQDVLDEIQALPEECLLLVGHEPQLSSLISYLTVGDSGLSVRMNKGSLACLEAQEPVTAGKSTLLWLVNTDHLRR
jgi:phosphohistidine phosphatase